MIIKKLLLPFLMTVGTTTATGSSIFFLLPNGKAKSDNSLTLYKTGEKGSLIIGDSSPKGEENALKAKNIIGISNFGWKYKNNSSGEIKNQDSFQLSGEAILRGEDSEKWKTILQDGGEESNKFSGSATFFLSGIDCDGLDERFWKSGEISRRKGVFNPKDSLEWFRDKGIVLWSCHEKIETIK